VGELLGEDGEPIIEDHELWIRNPVECVRELIGNPAFREYMVYAPERLTQTSMAGTDGMMRCGLEIGGGKHK
jgi:Plavaka transposase